MTAVQFPLGAQFEKVKREGFFFAVLLAPRVGLSITLILRVVQSRNRILNLFVTIKNAIFTYIIFKVGQNKLEKYVN